MMMRRIAAAVLGVAMLGVAAPAWAQIGGGLLDKFKNAKIVISEADEVQIGTDVSGMLRERYGVVQDPALHKYVTLVGKLMAQNSSRPNLNWQFIVLDTDGVNAFAAPGGFVHITRGALALIKNEAELADVLGHEITHVTEKHAVHAIEKINGLGAGLDAGGAGDRGKQLAQAAYKIVYENDHSRDEEMKADKGGIALAAATGYAPQGMNTFLAKIVDRYKDAKEKSGMFASHPDLKARMDGVTKEITAQKLSGAALVAARYTASVHVPALAPYVADPSAGGGSKLGLGGLSALGKDKSSDQTVSSGGSRGVNTDREAKGGPNKSVVTVTVTAAELADFRKGIAG